MIFDRPLFLYAILLIIPASLIIMANYKKIIKTVGFAQKNYFKHSFSYRTIKIRIVLRVLSWSLAWIFLCIAISGPYFGKKNMIVQKNSQAISFVFDISYSMMTQDLLLQNKQISRLEAARLYAVDLLSQLEGSAVSVVLTKGESILTVPLTDDFNIIYSLLENLSPLLISSKGSNLASGLDIALNSFPPQTASTNCIVFFTDGEETTQNFLDETLKTLEHGVNVVVIGFGDVIETEIITGNGKSVKSALQEEKLKSIQNQIVQKNSREKTRAEFLYVNSYEKSSAMQALKLMQPLFLFDGERQATVSIYDTKSAEQHHFFLLLAVIFFIIGLIINQFAGFSKNIMLLLFFPFFFN
ncbi:MAG: VWA domain-containing protein, partial [Treponemataceae bacterium]